MPDHDYDDVPIEADEGVSHKGRQLTPPVDATYSIVGSSQEEEYSHLGRTDSARSRDGESDEGHLTSPELHSQLANDASYSAISGSASSSVLRPRRSSDRSYASNHRGGSSPMLQRPQTSYESLHLGKERMSLRDRPLPPIGSSADDAGQVSRVKYNLIMEQLKKVQKEKELLEKDNYSLKQQLRELQQRVSMCLSCYVLECLCVYVCVCVRVRVCVCVCVCVCSGEAVYCLLLTAQQSGRREFPVAQS